MKIRIALIMLSGILLTGCNEQIPTAEQVKQAFITAGYGKDTVSQIKVEKCKSASEKEAICDITLDKRTVGRRFILGEKGEWLVSS